MKLICIPCHSRHFYLKPDTAVLRHGRTFYIPERCSRLAGAMALVVRIDRIGRHITQRFAHRYYHETALGFCLYAADVWEQNRIEGVAWGPACSFDYSAPLSDIFVDVGQVPLVGTTLSWRSEKQSWRDVLQENLVDSILPYLSQYIFLKMGDLIWIELHPPMTLGVGEGVEVFRNEVMELRFGVQ